MIWVNKRGTVESKDGRFYIVRKPGYFSLYDTRNRLAGSVSCDTMKDAKELAQKIAS